MSSFSTRHAAPLVPIPVVADAAAIAPRRLYDEGKRLLDQQKLQEALARFREASALDANFADAHNYSGVVLRRLGRLEEALVSFQSAIEIRHDHVEALVNQGEIYVELAKYEEAEDCFNLALVFDPRSAAAYFNLGISSRTQGRLEHAIANFYRAVELDPGSAESYRSLGGLFYLQGRLEQALDCYGKAEVLKPDIAEMHLNCGVVLQKLGKTEQAIARFERALVLKPDFATAHFHLGHALGEQEKFEQAIRCYERAIALKPDYAECYGNLGCMLKALGAIEQAVKYYRKAASVKPDFPDAYLNLGVVFNEQERLHEAIACYEKVLEFKPDHPEARLNLALTRLGIGDFERGWEGLEWRFRQENPDTLVLRRGFPHADWQGQELTNRSILVWGEQGIGDEILYASMYPEVIKASRRCMIECAAKLQPLFARSFPGARVVTKADPPHPDTRQHFDYQSAAGGLARWLRPGPQSFPVYRGYLVADPARVSYWKQGLAQLGDGLKVGFSWRSINVKGDRALACTRLDQWRPILTTHGVHFVCLQYDEVGIDLERAQEQFGVPLHAFPEIDLFNDIDEAAALTQALDLVVSAPTAVSILAAALGVTTWQMSYGMDWQTHGSERNLWYPTMTVFRRDWNQDWEEIIGNVARQLRGLAAGPDVINGAALPQCVSKREG